MAGEQAKVYRSQGASSLTIASGGSLNVDVGGSLNITSGAVTLPPNLKRGWIPIDLFSGRALASAENFNNFGPFVGTATQSNAAFGGILGGGDPRLRTLSTVAQAGCIEWASGTVTEVAFPPILLPPDFNTATAFKIHGWAERASDNASNNVLDYRCWVGVNATEMGTTGATLTSTPVEQQITVSATALAGNSNFITIHVAPGTHTNNAVRLFGLAISYDRLSS